MLLPEIVCEQINGRVRVYETADGRRYPSVTTLLNKYQSSNKQYALSKWRKRLGNQQADLVLKNSAEAGTFMHQCIEHYCKDDFLDTTHPNYYLFEQLIPVIESIQSVWLMESMLYSDQLQIAGSVDMMAMINDELVVIDFKNSGRLRNDAYNESYYAQLGMYGLMINERYQLTPKKAMVLVSLRNDGDDWVNSESKHQIFIKPMSECVQLAFVYLKKYHNDLKNGIKF